MRTIIIALCLVAFAATPALAGGGFFQRAAIRQGRRQGLREAARVNAFRANVYAPFRAQQFVAPVRRPFVQPVYVAPVRQFVAPSYGFQQFRSTCR